MIGLTKTADDLKVGDICYWVTARWEVYPLIVTAIEKSSSSDNCVIQYKTTVNDYTCTGYCHLTDAFSSVTGTSTQNDRVYFSEHNAINDLHDRVGKVCQKIRNIKEKLKDVKKFAQSKNFY